MNTDMLKEFREFAVKGSMLDLAIGIIIGTAFGAIVTALVKDIIMPPIGLALGRVDFKNLMVVLKDGVPPGPYSDPDAATKAKAVTLNYGDFINVVISFIIIAFVAFLIVKAFNRFREKQEAAAPGPTKQEELLTEIRDLLAKS